jgi:hypothetical protein
LAGVYLQSKSCKPKNAGYVREIEIPAWKHPTIERIKAKLEHLKDIARERERIEAKLDKVIPSLNIARYSALAIARHGSLSPTPIDVTSIQAFASTLLNAANSFRSFVPLNETIKAVTTVSKIPTDVENTVEALSKIVEKVPEPSKQDAARDFSDCRARTTRKIS